MRVFDGGIGAELQGCLDDLFDKLDLSFDAPLSLFHDLPHHGVRSGVHVLNKTPHRAWRRYPQVRWAKFAHKLQKSTLSRRLHEVPLRESEG